MNESFFTSWIAMNCFLLSKIYYNGKPTKKEVFYEV